MAVLPADLKAANGGRIEPELMFPDESPAALDQRLQKYIDEGVVKATGLTGTALDDAVKVWAYYRWADAMWIRLSSNPASVNLVDQGSSSYLQQQIQNFKDMADALLAEFDEAVETVTATADPWVVIRSHRRDMIRTLPS